jgi:DNA-binding MarR family transcriptional regulator
MEIIKKLKYAKGGEDVLVTDIIKERYAEKLKEIPNDRERNKIIAKYRPHISRILSEMEDWGLILKRFAEKGGRKKVVRLTPVGREILEYDNLYGISTPKSKKKKSKKTEINNEGKIPLSVIDFHSAKLRKHVIDRLIAEFPFITEDGIYLSLNEYEMHQYTGEDLSIESDEVLYEDFLANHIEFATSEEFKLWITQFKELTREWWKEYNTVINGLKLELEKRLGIPFSYQDDKLNGFTINLVNWIVEGMKCRIDPSCYKYYYKKYYLEDLNRNVEETLRRGIGILDYGSDNEIFIFKEKGELQPDKFKANMDKKLQKFMETEINKSPFFEHFQDNLKLLSKAKELREKIINILNKNNQIPMFKVRKCPYLSIVPV